MEYRELLEKQIKKCLTDAVAQQPEVQDFIQEISKSYAGFQKEKQLMTRAFKITEEEYKEINENLNKEIQNRKETIEYLKQALSNFTLPNGAEGAENLMDFSTKIVEEIRKRQSIEDTLKSLINNLNLGILLKDATDQFIYANKTFYDLFEWSSAIPDQPGDEISVLVKKMRSKSERKDNTSFTQSSTGAGYSITSQLWLLNDGRIIEENTIPYLYGDNQRGCIYTYSDITIREKSNEIIRKSELRNNQILRGSPNAVLLINANGDIKFTNEKTMELFGWSADDVLSMNIARLINLRDVMPGGCFQMGEAESDNRILHRNFEISTHKKDGTQIWIELTIIKLEETNDASYCCFSKDITARKWAESDIEKQKKFTEDILDNIPNDIAVFDKDQHYLFANRKAVQNDETRKWLIGKNDFDYCQLKNIDTQVAVKRRGAFLKAVKNQDIVEWMDEHKNKEGQSEYFQRKFHPHLENGEIKFVIGYGVDITKNILNQIQLEKSLELTRKINNELEYFAYIASHDLQEPLRTIAYFIARIEKNTHEWANDQTKQYFKYTIDATKRMRALILDLLEYSRLGQTKDETIAEIDLNELIQDIIVMHHQQIEELSARINVGELPVIHSQKTFIRQVFQNLINNGLKYHKEGVPPLLSVTAKDLGTHWQFSVADNGIGIEEEFFEKIFIIFQRLSTDNKYAGTGIGLAITRKIIELMNGKIWVESQKGMGSTFHFTILKN